MPQLRIALAQVDTCVGDIAGNARLVLDGAREAAARGAHLVAFPEMTLTGYMPEDLVLRKSFRAASEAALQSLAGELGADALAGLAVVVGYLADDDGLRNAAAVVHGGRVVATYYKHHLPNYGVFDEYRYFRSGDRFPVVRLHGVDVAVTICEDMWKDGGPFAVAREAGVGLMVNINGSPYERKKDDARLDLARRRTREAGAVLAYVNAVGGQDDLVFDGDSMVVGADGSLIARAPQFVPSLELVDLQLPAASSEHTGRMRGMAVTRLVISTQAVPAWSPEPPRIAEPLGEEAEVWGALVLATRDYLGKNSVRGVYLGLSGGIDSSVTAVIACDAIGAANVHGVSNPSAYSTQHSKDDAAELARRTGLDLQTVPIADLVEAYLAAVPVDGLAAENVQARIRAVVWMALSNQHPHTIVLACGNKSELATGYSTLYGDAVGGFAPIKDVPKSLVWKLARWRNADAVRRGECPPIPEHTIAKPPSAELRPGQVDTDSLPPYDVLDDVLVGYVDGDLGVADLVAAGHDPDLVARVVELVDHAEYKRRQYPPGPKISVKAFGRDRRLPITNRWRETPPRT